MRSGLPRGELIQEPAGDAGAALAGAARGVPQADDAAVECAGVDADMTERGTDEPQARHRGVLPPLPDGRVLPVAPSGMQGTGLPRHGDAAAESVGDVADVTDNGADLAQAQTGVGANESGVRAARAETGDLRVCASGEQPLSAIRT